MRSMKSIFAARRLRRWLLASVLAILSAVALTGCLNDLTPQGRWSAPVSDGNFIYVGNLEGVLVRVDAVSHAWDVNWLYPYELDGVRKKPKGLGAIYGAPVVGNGAVYAAGYTCAGSSCDGEVFGVSTDGGGLSWNSGGYPLRAKLVGQLQPTDNGLLLLGTGPADDERDPPGYLYAFSADPNAGRRVAWRVPLDGEVWGEAAVDNTTNTAYVGTDAGTLYAIDITESESDARVKWSYEARGAITGPILFHEGAIYFGDLSSRFYRLNPRTQSADWEFDTGAWVWAKAVPDDQNGAIYVSTLGGHVHALNISTGLPVWGQRIDGQIVGSPLLFDRVRNDFSQRVLAVPSGEQDVHALNVNDGQIIGTFPTDSAVKSSPVLINDFVYIHTLDGELKWYSPSDQTLQGCVALKDGGRCD
jgi:outer membrane protein assembly factor BamB